MADLRNSKELFENFIQKNANNRTIIQNLLELAENLREDLATESSRKANLTEILREFSETDSSPTSLKYLNLEKEYENLKTNWGAVKTTNHKLKRDYDDKKKLGQKALSEKEREVYDMYASLLEEKREELEAKQEVYEMVRAEHAQELRKLHDKIQIAQSVKGNDVSVRTVESTAIAEVRKKIRETMEVSFNLRTQLVEEKNKLDKLKCEAFASFQRLD